MEDIGIARCKACDTPFHPSWRKELNKFEDLCYTCLPIAMKAKWFSLEDDSNEFIDGYFADWVTDTTDQYEGDSND
jgi:hypothetical protein